MSKKLEKRATKLVRKAEDRAGAIRRAVREYRDTQVLADTNPVRQLESQLEIERAVSRYNRIHKELRRVRKKIEMRPESPRLLRAAGLRPTKRQA